MIFSLRKIMLVVAVTGFVVLRFLMPDIGRVGFFGITDRRLEDLTYVRHHFADVNFTLVLDTSEGYFNFMNATTLQQVEWAPSALAYKNAWLSRVGVFRQRLAFHARNNVDGLESIEDAPFRQPMERKHGLEQAVLPDTNNLYVFNPLVQAQEEDFDWYTSFYEKCLRGDTIVCSPDGDPLLTDISLVLPMTVAKQDISWPMLESLRQLVTFPREVVIPISGVSTAEMSKLYSFVIVLNDFYAKSVPKGVDFKVFLTEGSHRPGEVRWFGFNQTTMPFVLQFDGDDYMHPQMFQVAHHWIQNRPELDFGLIGYEAGTVEGVCDGPATDDVILRMLRTHSLSSDAIERRLSYPASDYNKARNDVPTWNKKWWLGNTDAEPNWGGAVQQWHDGGCHNGWALYRRSVMEEVPPPTKWFGGEDAIWNYRILRSGFNYHCLNAILGQYIKYYCEGQPGLWAVSEVVSPEDSTTTQSPSLSLSTPRHGKILLSHEATPPPDAVTNTPVVLLGEQTAASDTMAITISHAGRQLLRGEAEGLDDDQPVLLESD